MKVLLGPSAALWLSASLLASACSSPSPTLVAERATKALEREARTTFVAPLRVLSVIDQPCSDSTPPRVIVEVTAVDPMLFEHVRAALQRRGWKGAGPSSLHRRVSGHDAEAELTLTADDVVTIDMTTAVAPCY